jgi:hypothetical protein
LLACWLRVHRAFTTPHNRQKLGINRRAGRFLIGPEGCRCRINSVNLVASAASVDVVPQLFGRGARVCLILNQKLPASQSAFFGNGGEVHHIALFSGDYQPGSLYPLPALGEETSGHTQNLFRIGELSQLIRA